jgi:hypothetical protein
MNLENLPATADGGEPEQTTESAVLPLHTAPEPARATSPPNAPCAGSPLIQPDEAIAAALTVALKGIVPRMIEPDDVIVKTVIEGVHMAGWEFVPADLIERVRGK